MTLLKSSLKAILASMNRNDWIYSSLGMVVSFLP